MSSGKNYLAVALNVEGTLADVHKPFVSRYNSLYDERLSVSDITSWDFKGTKFKVDQRGYIKLVRELWRNHWRDIPLTETNVSETVKVLGSMESKYPLHIVTNHEAVDDEIYWWLEKHDLHHEGFLPLPPTRSKASFPYDIFIDDSPVLATELTGNQTLFLYDRPWNRSVKDTTTIRRFYNFSQLLEFLK